ncbi:hypothetical protein GOB93_14180 [Acetobacter musti]|uniref:Uncharacterized protein n=1 Tax=Acetobacter musti TaxID=864732 RepID=A0ABX0JRI2_9PROT|nr:hypothetical protein [Acetobacter musti]NHN85781.1 hypothetical protein [Acetobacter musti]
MEVQRPDDAKADGSSAKDRLPVLSRQIVTLAQAWAAMYPTACADTRRMLVFMVEAEIMGNSG